MGGRGDGMIDNELSESIKNLEETVLKVKSLFDDLSERIKEKLNE